MLKESLCALANVSRGRNSTKSVEAPPRRFEIAVGGKNESDNAARLPVGLERYRGCVRAAYTRLTSEQKRALIQGLIAEGKTQIQISRHLGISQSAVSQQLNGDRRRFTTKKDKLKTISSILSADLSDMDVHRILAAKGLHIGMVDVSKFMGILRRL